MTDQPQQPAQNPNEPGQPYPPHGYPPNPYPQQKKSSKVWWILGGIALVMLLGCGGCFAVVGLAANDAADEIDKSLSEEEENDKPTPIEEGKAFEHDNYNVDAGWKVARDAVGDLTITGMRVTNDSDEDQRTALFDITFYKGSENLAEVTCTSQELQAGESSKMDCFSADDFPRSYDKIQVADSF